VQTTGMQQPTHKRMGDSTSAIKRVERKMAEVNESTLLGPYVYRFRLFALSFLSMHDEQ